MKTILQLLCVTVAGFVLGSLLAFGSGTYATLVAGSLAAAAICTLYCILFLLHRIYVLTAPSIPIDLEDDATCDASLLGFDQQGTLKIDSVFLEK